MPHTTHLKRLMPLLVVMALLASSFISVRSVSGDANTKLTSPNIVQINIPVVLQPRSIATGDFNGDFYPDIVTGNLLGAASVVLSNGFGGFRPAVTYPMGDYWFHSGDFNNDGILDILTIKNALDMLHKTSLHVYLGLGAGVFSTTPVTSDLAPYNNFVNDLTLGDFNNDDKLDVAVVTYGPGISVPAGVVWLSQGNGAGGFTTNSFGVRPRGRNIDTADFNHDGNLDLAVRSEGAFCIPACQGAMQILLGNGSGAFPTVSYLTQFASLADCDVGDVNNDGNIDLVGIITLGLTGKTLSIILGTGTGDFVSGGSLQIQTEAVGATVLGDFNADGKLDAAVDDESMDPDVNSVYVVLGNGIGGFGSSISLNAGSDPRGLVAADFNRNGSMDLATANNDSNDVTILLEPTASTPPARTDFDFDGDHKADIAVYRDGNTPGAPSWWYVLRSSNDLFQAVQFGASGDKPMPVDFNGDGKADFAVWRPSNGTWYTSLDPAINYGAIGWGQNGDVPMPGDFNGDGRADYAVYRPASGMWYVLRSSDFGFQQQQFGTSTDKPVLGDFDGDGKNDYAFYRPGATASLDSFWNVIQSGGGLVRSVLFGDGGDLPVPADYDGDGITDFAVYRPSNRTWYTSLNPAINYGAIQWGAEGDVPTPADYDGDSKADIAIFRPGSTNWYILRSTNGTVIAQQWGLPGDRPIPSSFIP